MGYMSSTFAFDLVEGGAAILFVGAFFLPSLTRASSWRCRSSKNLMVFRTPVIARFYLIFAGIWLITTPMLIAVTEHDGWLRRSSLMLLAGIFGILLVLLASRRYELRLDLETRTYRLVRGWFFWPQVRLGPWSDFSGIFVRSSQVRGSDINFVGLAWQKEGISRCYLGRYDKSVKAEAFASEIASTLKLPVITAPSPDTFRFLYR